MRTEEKGKQNKCRPTNDVLEDEVLVDVEAEDGWDLLNNSHFSAYDIMNFRLYLDLTTIQKKFRPDEFKFLPNYVSDYREVSRGNQYYWRLSSGAISIAKDSSLSTGVW